MRFDRSLSAFARSLRPDLFICLSLLVFMLSGSALAAVSFPKPEGWVTDKAGLIDAGTRGRLEWTLGRVERTTGVEIAVVTLSTLAGQSVEEVAVGLFNAWGIGTKGKDEGVLLLVAKKERKLKIEVGYGLEGTIPDGLAGEIIRETIVPRFRQDLFAQGIEAGVNRIVETIAKQKQVDLAVPRVPLVSTSRPSQITISRLGIDERRLVYKATIFFVLLLVLLIGLAIAGERSRRRSGGRGRSRDRFWGFPASDPGGGWSSGGFGSSDSGGFGGFGGGSSGGGGASGDW